METILKIKEKIKKEFLNKKNVVGIGVGYKVKDGVLTDELAVIVNVKKKVDKSSLSKSDLVPKEVDGVKTDVFEIGEVKALDVTDPKLRYRPALGGVSIGHKNITAGTLGCVVKKDGEKYILSNNHVLANSNNASIGDAILQPGPYDGGTEANDKIAELSNFVPIDFAGNQEDDDDDDDDDDNGGKKCFFAKSFVKFGNFIARKFGSRYSVKLYKMSAPNYVDAALAKPINPEDVSEEIAQIGLVSGIATPYIYMPVKKYGRTTSFTEGKILQMGLTVTVSYGDGKDAIFENQILAGAMSQGGDSGSLIVESDSNAVVGLLFAGSTASTIINPIEKVMEALKFEF